MGRYALLALACLVRAEGEPQVGEQQRFLIEVPKVALAGVPFDLKITAFDAEGDRDTRFDGKVSLRGALLHQAGTGLEPLNEAGPAVRGAIEIEDVVLEETGRHPIEVRDGEGETSTEIRAIPGILSLLPPLLAIVLALAVREVLLALFSGVWLGVTFIHGYNPFVGLLKTLDTYLVGALADKDHAAIIMFSLTLGGMVGVISQSGGTEGIVAVLSRWARRPRGGQIATWAMGVLIFFDDYANTLVVGNTMRPLTDRLRISREKLSFIVDATAAPVTSIAVISSWVGFQVGLVAQAFGSLELERDAYLTFIVSIPYASYSVLMLVFVLLVGVTLRDYGPMLRAEKRTTETGRVLADNAQPLVDDKAIDLRAAEGTPLRWYNAGIPIAVVIVATMAGLYVDGRSAMGDGAATARLGEIIGKANSFDVLMWSSFLGAGIAIVLATAQRILTLKKALDAWLSGVKAMLIAMIILVLAWAIGGVCGDLGTADYVIDLTRGLLSPHLLPLLTFIVAAFIAFATGTSWATMAILTPIVIPMAHGMTTGAELGAGVSEAILLGTLGAVLSGAVFGDHCSPISDTTIMSSMTSAADHIDHVRTQLPYAVTVAGVACVLGYLPAGFGVPAWVSMIAGAGALVGLLLLFGRRVAGRSAISVDDQAQ
ncbi:Na+/H+ antiporter NhaC family protein [Myxococcota bacterium]